MAINQQNHQELKAHLMGALGTSNAPLAPLAATSTDATGKQTRHTISGASSVVSSSHSLSSSSTCRAESLGSSHAAALTAPPEDTQESPPQQQPLLVAAAGNVAAATALVGHAVPMPAPTSGLDPMVLHMNAPPHPVAEFLFQLTKMLTDTNSEYIEWRHASIFVHDPPGLEKDILPKYFRHSNYSSFQRQMNYFGFRKIAGKGKMSPCSYVNEAAKEDISSLLFIKRKKTGVSSAAAKLLAQQNRINRALAGTQIGAGHLMMGNALATLPSALPANANLAFNNLSLMRAGVTGNNIMTQGGAGNIVSAVASSLTQANILSQQQLQQHQQLQQQQQQHLQQQQQLQQQQLQQQQQQQNILAQLQQAHASALTNNQVQDSNLGGIPQGAQNKALSPGLAMNDNGGNNTVPLMTSQGNIIKNTGNLTDWSNSTDAATAQSLFIQQATQGLGGNFSQAMGGGNGAADSNGLVRLDSSANLRALLNQQISMFNNPGGDLASAMGNVELPLAAPIPSAGMVQAQGSSTQQGAGLTSIPTGNSSQGIPFDWNEMLQRMGGGGSVDNSAVQQLLQGSNNVTPGPAAAANPSFNLINGLFGPGGTTPNGAQGSFFL